ncbi:hypothetical protein OG979_21275 [Actinomadura citrea]|uniref:DUF6924 domain-containing protein n=1 Tax=Actinomadura citrea TaxID=46158 RepID=UPI002E2BCCE4|nr:hypothetical protein [Actinomadura citrea]
MSPLPRPNDMTSLILRTDFSSDSAWAELKTAIEGQDEDAYATYVSDPLYSGISIQRLVDLDAAASGDDKLTYIFLADAATMSDDERPLLAVDLYTDPGRTFRVPPRWYGEVSLNLSIANLDFDDFVASADQAGTFRGFDG